MRMRRILAISLITATIVTGVASAASAGYWIDESDQRYTTDVFGETTGRWVGKTCLNAFSNGVVRRWRLTEKNKRDFLRSSHFCRDMDSSGTLDMDRGSNRDLHFSYSGSGDSGSSSIPSNSVPTGIRAHWDEVIKYVVGAPNTYTHKLVDVEMLFDTAADVVAGKTNSDRAGSALNRSGDFAYGTRCAPGYVLTGLWVQKKQDGYNQLKHEYTRAEIRNVEIECSRLRD